MMETIQDGTTEYGGSKYDACQTISNGSQINGNIALIERGDCSFVDKVRRAQQAGAIAVIVMNRNDGSQADWSSAPITMGGSDADAITIPSVMINGHYRQIELVVNQDY